MAYCSYTAATVAVQDTKDDVPGARRRLDTYLRALNATSASCPGIQRSVGIIAKCLGPTLALPAASGNAAGSSGMERASASAPLEQMPAFPYKSNEAIDSMNVDLESMSPSFLHLDSYPQEWFNFTDDALDQFDFEFPTTLEPV